MKNIQYIIYVLALMFCTLQCSNGDKLTADSSHPTGRVTLEVSSDDPLLTMNEGGESGSVGFKTRGGECAIDVLCNKGSWSYEAEGAEWLTIEADKYFLRLNAPRNEEDTKRSATITISAGGGMASVTLYITQNCVGTPELCFEQNQLRIKAHTELQQSVAVETNCDEWDFEVSSSWLLVEKRESGLVLTADDNLATALREAEITIISGEASDKLVVRQDGTAFVKLNTQTLTAGYNGATKLLLIEHNPELEYTFSTSGEAWFSAEKGDEGLAVTFNECADKLQREGAISITVGYEGNSVEASVRLLQIGTDTEELIYEVEITEPNHTITAAPVLTSSSGGKIEVDWGDGSPLETFESRRGSHIYEKPGLYTISITGEAHNLEFSDGKNLCPELKSVISWGKLGYKNATDMCLGCSSLESIPDDVAGSFTNVVAFVGAFSCCEKLREIPAGLFEYATRAKRFTDCFSHCASISSIPENLFANCTAAEEFSSAFYGTGSGYIITNDTLTSGYEEVKALVATGKLTSIPEGLFSKCVNATKFDYIFGATALESIPTKLFAANSKATTFKCAFSACGKLREIPLGLMDSATAATDIKYMFAGCEAITEIPSGIFENCAAVTNLEYIFYRTGVKRLQKGIFKGLSGAKTIGAVFQDCKSLTEIEAGVFEGLTSAKSFRYCFADCTALRSIPAGLFAGMSNAYEFCYTFHNTALESVPVELFAEARDYSSADFTYMFSECKNLKTVPAGLFDRFTTVTSPGYKNLFDDSGIETIPAGLFAKSVKVSSGFEGVFENCPELKTIEGSIFPTTTSVTSVGYLFNNCPKLENIPADLFVPFGVARLKFTATFAGCSSLKNIPAELFASNTATTQFNSTFADCVALEQIPATLLAACTKVTTVKDMFVGCKSLKEIPETLFATNIEITSFEGTFAECTSLVSLPEKLFSAIGTKTSSIKFTECFLGCSALKSLPAGLFDTMRRINYIDGCFKGCTSLTGESPYTIVGEQKIHLYERTKGDDFPAVPTSSYAYKECFAGCEGLSDFANIPESWR